MTKTNGWARWNQWFGGGRSAKTSRSSREKAPAKRLLRLERLEERALLAVVTWRGDSGFNGENLVPDEIDFNNPANWSTGRVPGADDDVVIPDYDPGNISGVLKLIPTSKRAPVGR